MTSRRPTEPQDSGEIKRREFLKRSATVSTAVALSGATATATAQSKPIQFTDTFDLADSLLHPANWETLNPGYWRIEKGALRRRIKNVGDRARSTGFPFHAMSKGGVMDTDYDPSLPSGVIYRRDIKLSGPYTVTARFTYRSDRPEPSEGDDPNWKMYRDGYGHMGLAFGAKSLIESYGKIRHAVQTGWNDAGELEIARPGKQKPRQDFGDLKLQGGDQVTLRLRVTPTNDRSLVELEFSKDAETKSISTSMPTQATEGYVGIVGRGLIDFEVNEFSIHADQLPGDALQPIPELGCLVCYPLGDTLKQNDAGKWTVRFVGLS